MCVFLLFCLSPLLCQNNQKFLHSILSQSLRSAPNQKLSSRGSGNFENVKGSGLEPSGNILCFTPLLWCASFWHLPSWAACVLLSLSEYSFEIAILFIHCAFILLKVYILVDFFGIILFGDLCCCLFSELDIFSVGRWIQIYDTDSLHLARNWGSPPPVSINYVANLALGLCNVWKFPQHSNNKWYLKFLLNHI